MTYAKFIAFAGGLLLCATSAQATPQIEHWTLANGARVYFVENHDLPMLDVVVDVAAGSGYDPADKSGVAGLTQDLLKLGVEGMTEDDISKKLADTGAQLGGHFDADRAGITLRTLSNAEQRDEALDIMARVLQHPLFSGPVLEREKTHMIESIKESETKPEAIAEKAFNRAVFGTHPYGVTTEADSVAKIQRDDLTAFYRTHYVAKSAVVAIMGDATQTEAEAIARKLTDELPQGAAPAPLPPVNLKIQASEQRIAHPATQSHILIGAPGISRTDPDYFTLYVGNYILGGGGFVSRLMNEVREKRGLAYSVYSYFFPMQQPGVFQIGLQTKKEQADEALQLARATVRTFIADGPTQKELDAAKDNIIGGFPLRIDSNQKIVEYLSVIGFYHLPLTYLDDFTQRVKRVSVADIRAAFKRHIDPNAMATVIVGAPELKAEGEK